MDPEDDEACDDAMLLLAARGQRTLSGKEVSQLDGHLATCEGCRQLGAETREDWRWVARIPQDAFDDPNLLVFPVVDPIVFANGQVIARGGMGQITRATDRRLGREVAIKEVLDGAVRQRFEREAMITARLQHPAIVPIYEAGTWPDGSVFYTMRLVEGVDLATAIGKATTIEERIALLSHVVAATDALAYAHARKIIHRDLKPGNVLVGAYGETVVIDWGIAKELGRTIDDAKLPGSPLSGAGLTRMGTILGTPGFMPPEQARGEALDQRADVFALGALLYNTLAGTPPYWDRFDDPQKVLDYAMVQPPTPIAVLAPDAPTDLHTIVEKAMARAPSDRYADAGELAAELRRFQAGQLIAREYTLGELVRRWLKKHRTAVVVGAVAVAVLAVFAVIAAINVRASRDSEREARVLAEERLQTARDNAAATLEEQARTEVLTGDRGRGLVYAVAAFAAGRDTPSLRYLLAVASRHADLQLTDVGAPDLTTACGNDLHCAGPDVEAMGYSDPETLVVVETSGRVSIWRGGKRQRFFALPDMGTARVDPAGKRVAAIGETKLAMWDVATGTRLWSELDPAGDDLASELLFDPTGSFVVAWSDEAKDVVIRDAATGRIVHHADTGVRTAAVGFSADGQLVAACGDDGAIRVWTTAGFTEVARWTAAKKPSFVGFVGRDRIVVDSDVPAAGRAVSVWAFSETPPRRVSDLADHGPIIRFAAAPDGQTFATGDDELRLWTRDGKLIASATDGQGRYDEIAFVRDAIVTHAIDDRLLVYERSTLGRRVFIDAHSSSIDVMAIEPTRARIASAGDQHVIEWAMPASPLLVTITSDAAGTAAAFAGDRLVVADSNGIATYRASDGGLLVRREIALGGRVTLGVAGTHALAQGVDRRVILDLVSGSLTEIDANGQDPLELSGDGRYAFVRDDTNDKRPAVRIWDMTTGKQVRRLAFRSFDSEAVLGDTVVFVHGSKLFLYSIDTGKRIGEGAIAGRKDAGYELTATRDRIVATTEKQVFVLDATGAQRANISSRFDLENPQLSADGTQLLTATDHRVRLWDVATGTQRSLIDRDANLHRLDTEHHRVITTNDGTVRLWDLASGRQLDAIDVSREPVTAVVVSEDGARLAVVAGTTVTLVDVHLEGRSVDQLQAIASHVPWKLVEGTAIAK